MKKYIEVICLVLMLYGCADSESEQYHKAVQSVIDGGRVISWRSPSLHKLNEALAACELDGMSTRFRISCNSRHSELTELRNAFSDCSRHDLPMCSALLKLLTDGPRELFVKVISGVKWNREVDFHWYSSPQNRVLNDLFGPADRYELLKLGISENAVSLFLVSFLFGLLLWVAIHVVLEVQRHESKQEERKAEALQLQLAIRSCELEESRRVERMRQLELKEAARIRQHEVIHARLIGKWHQQARQERRSEERERILRMLTPPEE